MASPQIVDLTVAYQARYNELRRRVGTALAALWGHVGNVDDAAIDRFVSIAVPVVTGGQREALRLLAGFLALLTGGPVDLDTAAILAGYRGGVPPEVVYRRPGITARAALTDGLPWLTAMRQAGDRAASTGEVDMAWTQRAGIDQAASTVTTITGYRRTLTGNSCALCATASTRIYRAGDLMPIHNHCDCGVAPVIAGVDPAASINEPIRARVLTGQADTPAVHVHGELGPVLTVAGEHFDGPSSIN